MTATVSAETLVTNETVESSIVGGAVISLQCKDTNGGVNYYFNGDAVKSATFQTSNLFTVVAVEGTTTGEFYLQQNTSGKFVGGSTASNSLVQLVDDQANANKFTAAVATPTGWTTKPADVTAGVNTIRFTTNNTFLNTNSTGSVPKYFNGTGGFSAWYVYTYSADEVSNLLSPTIDVAMNVVYKGETIATVTVGAVKAGEEYVAPTFSEEVFASVEGLPTGSITEAVTFTATLVDGVKPFKLNNLKNPTEWATTNTIGLLRAATSYDAGEYLIEVPVADSGNFKIYSINQLSWVGAAGNNARQVTFAETAGVFQLLKHSCGAEAIGNAGAASDQQVFFNTRDGGIGTWSADNDAGSHWFMVYDNSNYQANREAAAITIDSSSGSVTGSAFGSALTEAEAKYAAVENIDDNVMEGFGEQKAALKAAIDAAKAARFGAEGVDVAAIIAELTATSAAINPNVEHYAKGLVIIANADAFVAMGIPSEEGITAWNEAKTVANAVEPTEFTNEAYEAVLAAYNALVATSANTPGEAHVKMASWKVAEDFMCVRHNPSSYSIYRNGSDVNENKTTWTLKAAEGGFYLFNEYSAKYLRIATQDNQPATPVETTEEASIFVFDIFEAQSARYGIKHVGGAPSVVESREYLHSNATNTILRWMSGDASSWYLSASDAETAQSEASIGAAEDVENALQYFDLSEKIGEELGYYTVSEEYATALAAAKEIAEDADNAAKHSAADALRAAYATEGAFALNLPQAGNFYRIKGYEGSWYITPESASGQMAMTEEPTEASVFRFDEVEGSADTFTPISYTYNVGIQGTHSLGAAEGSEETYTFAASESGFVGAFTIKSNYTGSKYVYNAFDGTGTNEAAHVDRCDGYDPRCNWILEEVKDPTAIEEIEAESNGEAVYFDLNGRRVVNPANGLFIKRQGNSVSKIIL